MPDDPLSETPWLIEAGVGSAEHKAITRRVREIMTSDTFRHQDPRDLVAAVVHVIHWAFYMGLPCQALIEMIERNWQQLEKDQGVRTDS